MEMERERESHPQKLPSSLYKDNGEPWLQYAVNQAILYQQVVRESMDSAVFVVRSRLYEAHSISSDIFYRTSDAVARLKDDYDEYDSAAVRKIREGIRVVADHPSIACGAAIGSGLILLKRPRQFLFRRAIRLFLKEETLLANAEAKVKELRQSVELVKNESKKLEERAKFAEEEIKRGQTKLRQAGSQIQNVIRSVDKIEKQAKGLKDILGELPRAEASRFRSQISSMTSEVKHEKGAMGKAVAKITNYGISI